MGCVPWCHQQKGYLQPTHELWPKKAWKSVFVHLPPGRWGHQARRGGHQQSLNSWGTEVMMKWSIQEYKVIINRQLLWYDYFLTLNLWQWIKQDLYVCVYGGLQTRQIVRQSNLFISLFYVAYLETGPQLHLLLLSPVWMMVWISCDVTVHCSCVALVIVCNALYGAKYNPTYVSSVWKLC